MSSSTSELGKQYMLVVADTLKEAKNMASAVHSELLSLGLEHSYRVQSRIIETANKHITFTYYDSSFCDRVIGCRFTQVVITQFSSEYNQNVAQSLVRGEGEQLFQVGYNDIWEVVGLVNKFLGVSDE